MLFSLAVISGCNDDTASTTGTSPAGGAVKPAEPGKANTPAPTPPSPTKPDDKK
jgi:hypothetical protein